MMNEKNDEKQLQANLEASTVYKAALDILKEHKENSPLNGKKLMEKLNKDDTIIHKKTIYSELLSSLRHPDSEIASKKGPGGGYYKIDSVGKNEKIPSPTAVKNEKTKEKHLYPAVAQWLLENELSQRVNYGLANSRSGQVWSNPDVIGLSIFKDLGFFDVQILTAEVKIDLKSWRYYFFEAVSHKRFSERVYFIYGSNGNKADEIELRQYSEKYRVGLVKMEFTRDDLTNIQKWKNLSYLEKIDLVERFVEVMPAPFEAISIKEKVEFLRRIGIDRDDKYYKFGQELEQENS